MGGQQGYSKVTTNNLIFAYDTGDKINSYKGRPTDNLIANAGISIYNNVGGDVSITLTQTSDSYKGASIWKEVITPTTSTGVSYLTNGNNPGIGVVTTGGGGIANRYTGHTIFFKPVGPMFSSPIFTNYSNIAGWQSSDQYESMGDGWFRAKVLWYDTVTRTDGKYWAINPSGATINVPITIYWAGPFKEDLNSTTISQFINGTRSVTQGLINLANPAATLDLTSVSFDSNAQIVFDGTDDYVSTNGVTDASLNSSSWTMEAVVKFDTVSKAGSVDNAIFGHGVASNSNGLHLGERTAKAYFGFYNNDLIGTITLSAGKYYLIHWVYNQSTASKTIYVNGVYDVTSTQTAYTGTGNNFEVGRYPWAPAYLMDGNIYVGKIYSRTLTQAEITQNYNHYKTRFSLT
mgnify:CR=1 FL=1|jgi:hypothetical protein